MDEDDAMRLADLIVADLEDRSGFDAWWHAIDSETQDEIKGAISDIIREGE